MGDVMKLRLWQADAFAEKAFAGNPAAMVPLEKWLPDAVMQSIALENNLSETAFFVKYGDGLYGLRWFTPAAEVDLCGHATLTSAWLIFREIAPDLKTVQFETRSGSLTVERSDDGRHRMFLPADPVSSFAAPDGFEAAIGDALGVKPPKEVHIGRYVLAVWDDVAAIKAIRLGDLAPILRSAGVWGLVATAGGPQAAPYDFVSRFFAPDKGVPEDPVTGSAHCALVPFWAKRLGKPHLHAYQASQRSGDILCTDNGATVTLSGACRPYLTGEIEI